MLKYINKREKSMKLDKVIYVGNRNYFFMLADRVDYE